MSSIDSGPLAYTVGMEVNYAYLPAGGFRYQYLIERTKAFWRSILSQEETEIETTPSVEEKTREAWMGKGNLWCLAAPNR